MGIKMTLTFEDETMETLRRKAKEDGVIRPSVLARYLLLRGFKEDMQAEITDDRKTFEISVDNYRTLLGYAQEKKLGSVEVFAAFAMEQYMSRVPLTEAQKRRVEERYGNTGADGLA
jgi:hypothetical protein